MSAVFSVLLVGLVGLFVAWPFVRPEREREDTNDHTGSPLERQKLEAYAALRDSEFDWRMGKLSDSDYQLLQEQYRRQALAAIAAIEEARGRLKRERRTVSARPPRRISFCPACGQRVPPQANFCGQCGGSLRERVA